MAVFIAAGTLWEVSPTAAANNVNGGGFNTGNTHFPTDLAADTGTGNTATPIVSSASYNFVAGDVNAWIYIQAGTNWTPGFYQITSVAANKATLNAAIGAGNQKNASTLFWDANTVNGVATVATPTGGTFGIDYSRGNNAIITNTDLASANGTSTPSSITSAGSPFGINHIGNIIHVTAGTSFRTGWQEIVNVSGTTATLDSTQSVGTAASLSGGTFYVGGAISLNSTLDDAFFESVSGSNFVFIKNGSYSLGQNLSISAISSGTSSPNTIIGYNSIRGDNPSPFGPNSNAPTINCGTFTILWTLQSLQYYLRFTGTAATMVTNGNGNITRYCYFINTSTTAARIAFQGGQNSFVYQCEAVSQNGTAFTTGLGTPVTYVACFAHDSTTGYLVNSTGRIINSIALSCRTKGLSTNSGGSVFYGNTVYGYVTPRGTGFSQDGQNQCYTLNNLIVNCNIGMGGTTNNVPSSASNYNFLYGNTTNWNLFPQGQNDVSGTNPVFTNVTELSGSTATTSGSVLTQSGGDFSTVTDNRDFIQIHSGTGVTVGIYLITSHTSTTVTLNNAPGTDGTSDKVWTITTGRNLAIGGALRGLAIPGSFGVNDSVGYMDPGAVQRQELTSTVAYPLVAG